MEDVQELVPWDRYLQERPQLFASPGSLEWFVRRHRAALVARGALLLHAGRWLVHGRRMDQFVVDQGAAAAQRQIERMAQ